MTTNKNEVLENLRNECSIDDFCYSCRTCERYKECLNNFIGVE